MNEAPFQLEMEMPAHSWDEGLELRAQDGSRLKREGSLKEAMPILGYKDPESVRDLIKAGEIPGRKKNPAKSNSPFLVDLLARWEYRQAGLRQACQ